MSKMIAGPVMQMLGFDNESFMFKLVFPISQYNDRAITDPTPLTKVNEGARYGAIFKVRAEDLPCHSNERDQLVVFDVGGMIQEKLASERTKP